MTSDFFAIAVLGLLPIAAIIGLGFILRTRLITDPSSWAGLDRLNFFVLIPCLVIATLAEADIARLPIWTIAGVMLGALIIIMGALFVGYAFLPKTAGTLASYSSVFQTATRWNGSVALVIVGQFFDDEAIGVTALTMMVLMPVINIVNVAMMVWLLNDRMVSWGAILLKILRNPILISCVLGMILAISGLPLWAPTAQALTILGDASFGTILLSVGAGLSFKVFTDKIQYICASVALKLLLMPALVLALGLMVGLDLPILAMAMVIAAMPTAMNGYVLAKEMGGDAVLYAGAGTLQTVGSLITIPVWTMIALSLMPALG